MTTLNPLGDKPFRVNVYREDEGLRYGLCLWAVGSLENSAVYRLKVTPWIPHDGGPCPVGENGVVKIRYRSGKITRPVMVGAFPDMLNVLWKEIGNSPDDIVAYQIVE